MHQGKTGEVSLSGFVKKSLFYADSLHGLACATSRIVMRVCAVLTLVSVVAGCSTLRITPSNFGSVQVSSDQSFALLEFENFSTTPQANGSFKTLLGTQLQQAGVAQVISYDAATPVGVRALVDVRRSGADATSWANQRGARYALSGAVHEWRYQLSSEREPVIGFTVVLTDLQTQEVLWRANGATTGWGKASLSAVADKAIAEMLQQIDFVKSN